jgi:hypothetical protein
LPPPALPSDEDGHRADRSDRGGDRVLVGEVGIEVHDAGAERGAARGDGVRAAGHADRDAVQHAVAQDLAHRRGS